MSLAPSVYVAQGILHEVEDEPELGEWVEEVDGEVRPRGVLKTAFSKLRLAPEGENGDEQPPPEAAGKNPVRGFREGEMWMWVEELLTPEEIEAVGTTIETHDRKYPWT